MEVTATALLCLNTSSRLSCGGGSKRGPQLAWPTVFPNPVPVGSTHLRLRQHVQTPGTHFAVSGNADQVVGVLRPDHADTVDGMLIAEKRRRRSF